MLKKLCASCVLALSLGLGLAAPVSAGVVDAGTSVAKQSEVSSTVAARKGCYEWTRAVAGLTGWRKSEASCGMTGGPKVTYKWEVAAGSNGRICVQARGIKKVDGKTTFPWINAGCGTKGSVKVPWPKNALGVPAVRAKMQPGFLGAAYVWRANG